VSAAHEADHAVEEQGLEPGELVGGEVPWPKLGNDLRGRPRPVAQLEQARGHRIDQERRSAVAGGRPEHNDMAPPAFPDRRQVGHGARRKVWPDVVIELNEPHRGVSDRTEAAELARAHRPAAGAQAEDRVDGIGRLGVRRAFGGGEGNLDLHRGNKPFEARVALGDPSLDRHQGRARGIRRPHRFVHRDRVRGDLREGEGLRRCRHCRRAEGGNRALVPGRREEHALDGLRKGGVTLKFERERASPRAHQTRQPRTSRNHRQSGTQLVDIVHVPDGDAAVAVRQAPIGRQLANELDRSDETGACQQHLARDDRLMKRDREILLEA